MRTNADTIDADYVDNTQTNDQRSMTNDPTLTDEYGASKERKSKEQNDQRVITDNQQITTDDKDEKNEERIRERRGENPPQPSFLKEGVGHGNDPSEIVRQGRNFTGQAEGRGGNIERRFLSEAQQKILELKSVKEEFDKLSSKVFPDLKIAMLHGKMKSIEKEKIMKGFLDKEYDILVCTSVVEVGIDVPNATIMMIEGSDRFGLAQLYQFRGRVGRGAHQSFCFLFTDSESQSTQKRLEFLQSAKNGFELAEKDLELRGPGQFLGKVQTGIPDIAMDSLKDIKLVKAAKSSAEELLSNDPKFSKHPLLAKRFKEFQERVHME
ncbi:hypothetical protein KKF47_00195 [Patescibacteria group bacterium]|nr:hypothetical protein [Patescibacteria group bacterium]